MSKLGKMVKDMVKTKKESVMGKLGDAPYEDPMEPWSAKYNSPVKEEVESLTEESILYRYIRSKGYSPEHMDFAHRSAFARSRAFKTYKMMHQKKDTAPQGGISDIKAEEVQIDEAGAAEIFKSSAENAKAKLNALKAIKKTNDYEKQQVSKSVVSEAGVGKLMNFIKAKGLDPSTMDGNQRSNYSRSSEFRVFKVTHKNIDDKLESMKAAEKAKKKKKINEIADNATMYDIAAKRAKAKLGALKAMDATTEYERQRTQKLKEISGMGERGDDWNEESDSYVKVSKIKSKLKESVDEKDTVTMDIPLLIRVLEYAREDAKTDMDLHKVVENLINMRDEGTLSMDMYDKIVAIKEEIEKLDEISKGLANRYMWSAMSDRKNNDEKISDAISKNSKEFSKRRHSKISKLLNKSDKRSKGISRALDRLQKEDVEQIDELKASTYGSYINKVTDPEIASKRGKTPSGTLKSIKAIGGVAKAIGKKAKAETKELKELKKIPDNMDSDDHITREEKMDNDPCWKGYDMVGTKKKGKRTVPNCVPEEVVNEGIYGIEDSPLSATNSVKAMEANNLKSAKMKSARMIKSIYKKKLKESTYDWEKDDKPAAKIIMKGGKTMTGQPRDTVEIEPILKTRPNSMSGKTTKPGV